MNCPSGGNPEPQSRSLSRSLRKPQVVRVRVKDDDGEWSKPGLGSRIKEVDNLLPLWWMKCLNSRNLFDSNVSDESRPGSCGSTWSQQPFVPGSSGGTLNRKKSL